jgi:chlorobactene glucosyltransferase
LVYQIIIAAGLALFLVNLFLNLRSLKAPRADARVPRPAPLISVMVPARDEAENIGACLESLLKQDYPNFEILVLDDNSTDNTAAIVAGLAAQDSRIKLIQGQPLPEDWAGKPHACHQLSQHARGDWFLFVDADTTHAPGMLRGVLDLAIEQKVSLLSGFPRQLVKSLPQKIGVPIIYFIIMSWAPLWLIHRLKTPRPSVAIGQFLFFSSREYRRIGGHEVVKSRILEDIWMGIEMARRGGRHVAVDLSPVVFCNMYPTALAMWRGLVRCVYSVTAIMPLALLVLVALAVFCYIGPFYWFVRGFFIPEATYVWRGVVFVQMALAFLTCGLVVNRFKEPGVSAGLYPVSILFLLITVLYAMWRWLIGAGVTWKERAYGRESAIE